MWAPAEIGHRPDIDAPAREAYAAVMRGRHPPFTAHAPALRAAIGRAMLASPFLTKPVVLDRRLLQRTDRFMVPS
jgi:hypothetical protein